MVFRVTMQAMSVRSVLWSRLRRVWQPRHPLFWLMCAFNAASSAMAWVLHVAPPAGVAFVMLVVLALANAVAAMVLLLRLMVDEAGVPHTPP